MDEPKLTEPILLKFRCMHLYLISTDEKKIKSQHTRKLIIFIECVLPDSFTTTRKSFKKYNVLFKSTFVKCLKILASSDQITMIGKSIRAVNDQIFNI